MNKKFKPDFDHLLDTAYIIEGHSCHGAGQGCCCRGCSECEENYRNENYESEMEESEEPGLREIMDSLGKPDTDAPYGEDPEADNPEYNENNELANISDVVGAVMNLPTKKELKEKGGGILGIGRDPVIKKALNVRSKAVQALDKELRDIESRLR